ncbi:MAG: GMC family oxidoreductase N-terminal domain-containing protein [Deltaproteobacteria bacterium]|nr:GMC family oxidoreductase N-terminal domain-containing protein [Deltaproteobacteria bacterium]
METRKRHIIVVGGGTAGSVLAARLCEDSDISVTLLEAGPDHDAYDAGVLEPIRAADAWTGVGEHVLSQSMATETGSISMIQGRLLGGTSAVNGLATLRGQPADYDAWADAGLEGWGWDDVANTFIAAERDMDFGSSPIHGNDGPLPVRRWRKEEMSRSQTAFYQGMIETGQPATADINDPSQLPGIGIFPVTIDEQGQRVSTSLAYLSDEVRARDNLEIRTHAEVATIAIEDGRANGVVLVSGEEIEADEVVVAAGALWSPTMLLRSGVGPKEHLAEYGIEVHADLPVGSTMSDHLGAGILYRHDGPRGGVAGPAQVVLVGASNGKDADYHLMPVSLHDPEKDPLTLRGKLKFFGLSKDASPNPGLKTLLGAMKFLATPTAGATLFVVAVFLLRSSGRGSVRLGSTPEARPTVVAPPLPEDAPQRLRPAFDQLAAWERSAAFRALKLKPVFPHDLGAPDAVATALERNTMSYGHMVGTCPMGPVLDADCRVHGIPNLRVADASVMPTIPCGNTYLGCVMVAERIASKMKAGKGRP